MPELTAYTQIWEGGAGPAEDIPYNVLSGYGLNLSSEPKLGLQCFGRHAKVAEVVNHTIGVYTATTSAWDMDLCQPTCKTLYLFLPL